MTINWKIRENIVNVDEGSELDYIIEYEPIDATALILSSTLPNGVYIDDTINGKIRVYGVLPQIGEDTSYYMSLRLTNHIETKDAYLKINSKNLKVTWDEAQWNTFSVYTSTEINEQLKLKNTNGSEVFKKTSGSLPHGLILSETGYLVGNADFYSDGNNEYEFTVDIFKNGNRLYDLDSENSLNRTFKIIVEKSNDETPPYWITEPGIIGNINYNETSKIKLLAYGGEGSITVTYKLDPSYPNRLPPGIALYSEGGCGVFKGVLGTIQSSEYEFSVLAEKYIKKNDNSNYEIITSAPRTFIIKTNDVAKEHRIIWPTMDELDLGTYTIGSNIIGTIPMPSVEDGSNIIIKLNSGNIPDGLSINSNGAMYGKLNYQKSGDYHFTIVAETPHVSSVKNVVMHLKKGLGNNALNVYFRINNEYRNEYIDIKNQLNKNTLYKQSNDSFIVDTFPKVDIATLTCFDKEVLSNMLNFGNDEVIRFGKTNLIEHVQVNNNGETVDHYDIIYKSVDESTYQWEPQDFGKYDFEDRLNYLKSIDEIDDDAELEFNKTKYHLDIDNDNIVDSNEPSFEIFNFKNFRELLSKPIYVYKKYGKYFYSVGSQELIDINKFKTQYNLYRLDSDGYYRVTQNNNISFEDKIVKYECRKIYDEYGNLMDDVLFVPCEVNGMNLVKSNTPFIISEEYESPYYIKEIENPICFDRDKNDIELNNLPPNKEMVLPYISDDDVIDDGDLQYIKFLDIQNEELPEWKRDQVIQWQPNTVYLAGDVIINDAVYYECLQEFKSGMHFIFDENLFKVLSNDEIQSRLSKKYFPTLDLGYFEPKTNRYYLSLLNEAEDRGEYWNNRDFYMYELTCEPLFNKELESFVIQLNRKMNKQYT